MFHKSEHLGLVKQVFYSVVCGCPSCYLTNNQALMGKHYNLFTSQ